MLEHPIWFAEIGPEIVHCISHISVSEIVPAVVPDIPELPAIVLELVVHCNFNTDVFSSQSLQNTSPTLPVEQITQK